MFKLTAAAALLLSTNVVVFGDNTPNLCTDDIPGLMRIPPSETGVKNIPNITVGSEEYNSDADHFVIGDSDTKAAKKGITVYLPGTTDRPELSSCLLKAIAAKSKTWTIGLSYAYLSSGDGFRNGKCASLVAKEGLDEQINCLEQQHIDAIEGGDYGATHFKEDGVTKFWDEVKPKNSINFRLVKLFEYLDDMDPSQGWSKLIKGGTEPNWKKITVIGHSQGAGHVAYLAQKKKLMGASMISGPKDQCLNRPDGTKFWIDNKFKTKKVFTAFASADETFYTNGVMPDNWNRMSAFGDSPSESSDIDFAVNFKPKQAACNGPLLTSIKYAATSTCRGMPHCSTAIDDSVPNIEKTDGSKLYLYDHVWSALANANECKKLPTSSPTETPKGLRVITNVNVFGDSLTDTGNRNQYFPCTATYCPPRSSNGPLVVELFLDALGLGPLVAATKPDDTNNPALPIPNSDLHNVNTNWAFASAAAYTEQTRLFKNDFAFQLELYKAYLEAKQGTTTTTTPSIEATTLQYVSFGANDVSQALETPTPGDFINSSILALITNIQTLAAMGACSFLVIGPCVYI